MTTGVLLTGFGGPDSIESVGPFMCNLMGKEPSDELVERVCMRYLSIGGKSPLVEIATAIGNEIGAALKQKGHELPVALGMRYWDPYIVDGLAALKQAGCDRVITISLSPFESKVAHGAYREAIAEAAEQLGGIEVVEAPLVSELQRFVDFFAGAIAATLSDLEPNHDAILVFTAHSLPMSDLVDGDPYIAGLERAANRIASKLDLPAGSHGRGSTVLPGFSAFGSEGESRPWFLVYQSKGNRPGGWLGPDIDELIEAAQVSRAVKALVVCPIGFMTDHMETLYDLDIVAADAALTSGLEFARVPVPNQDELLAADIADSIIKLL